MLSSHSNIAILLRNIQRLRKIIVNYRLGAMHWRLSLINMIQREKNEIFKIKNSKKRSEVSQGKMN